MQAVPRPGKGPVGMSEFFIVVQPPTQYETLEEARAVKDGFAKHFPDKEWTILRCKAWLNGAKHFAKMVELMADIHRDGLTAAHKDRLTILLGTIGTRTPKLQTLIRRPGPPEFQPRGGTASPCTSDKEGSNLRA